MVTLDIFLLESNALKALTSSFVILFTALEDIRNDINARSVLLPPMMAPSLATALLLTPIPVITSRARFEGIFERALNTVTLPVAISTTESLPSVMVPVLSLKRMLRLPAVSKPLIL